MLSMEREANTAQSSQLTTGHNPGGHQDTGTIRALMEGHLCSRPRPSSASPLMASPRTAGDPEKDGGGPVRSGGTGSAQTQSQTRGLGGVSERASLLSSAKQEGDVSS